MELNENLVEVCASGARKIVLGGFWPDLTAVEQAAWRGAARAILSGDETGLSDLALKVLTADYKNFVVHAEGGDVLRHAIHAIEAGWYSALASPKTT